MSLKNRTPNAALKMQRALAQNERISPDKKATNVLQKKHFDSLRSLNTEEHFADELIYEKELNLISKLRKLAQTKAPSYQALSDHSIQQEYMGLRDEILRMAQSIDSPDSHPTMHPPTLAFKNIDFIGETMHADQSPRLIRLNLESETGYNDLASKKIPRDQYIPRLHSAPINLDSYKELVRQEDSKELKLDRQPASADFAVAAAKLIQDQCGQNGEPDEDPKLALSLLDLT